LTFLFHPSSPSDISPLSLHDALPICISSHYCHQFGTRCLLECGTTFYFTYITCTNNAPANLFQNFITHYTFLKYFQFDYLFLHRSEEHTSELQSRENLVCRLLLEKKK